MKHKILINGGSSALLRDFFVSGNSFTCMSTSGYWVDLSAHYEMYQPDAYVCIAEYEDPQLIAQFKRLKSNPGYAEVPIIAVTSEDSFEYYTSENEENHYIDLILSRPITIAAITDKIKKLLRDIEEEKQRIAEEQAEAECKAREAIEAEQKNRRKHILVVDDDKNILKLLKSALEEKYDVTAIVNGKMALKFLESKTPDLIFLDYQMPVDNGPEVFKKIKKMESAKDVPIVFLTGVADREKIVEVLMLKPQGYLLKPIDIARVFKTIEEII